MVSIPFLKLVYSAAVTKSRVSLSLEVLGYHCPNRAVTGIKWAMPTKPTAKHTATISIISTAMIGFSDSRSFPLVAACKRDWGAERRAGRCVWQLAWRGMRSD